MALLVSEAVLSQQSPTPSRRTDRCMDAPICALLGAMAPLLRKIDSVMASRSTLLEEEGVRNQLDLLVGGLNEINTTLVDVSEAEFPPSIAKIWMKDVRDLSYDLQDYFELTIHSGPGAGIDPSKARTAGKRSGLLKIPLLHNRRLKNPSLSSSPLATKIMEFSARVQQACQARVRYGLHQLTLERRFVCYGPRLPSLQDSLIIDHSSLDEIEKCLATDDGNKQLKVISIVGSAGVGKTTLAKRLYNKHRGAFQFRAFVRVSSYPDMRRLLTSIFVQIHKQQPQIDWDANDLIDKIAQHLENKRYFIIIDDLWDASVWDIVYRAFPKVSGCSRVITTTQVEDVALACSSYLSNNKFKIGPLDEKDSAELFFSKVFGREDDCPTEFKEISYEIIRQCGGLPLSTINTAGMLASEPGFLMEQWKHIQHSLCPSSMTNASELLVHLKESQFGPSAEQSISRDTMVNSPVEEIDIMEDLFKSPIEDTQFMSAEDETGLKEAQSKYPVKDSRVEFGRKQMDRWSNNETDLQYTSLRTDHTSERMKKVINLVYHYLPPHLKTCLLYLNMYPADYMIRKDDLVKQWVAEDFISSVEGQDREEVARTYFDELINRGMLQAVDRDCNDQVLSCTVHHMILDLIAYKSMEDNFITIVDYFQRSLGVLDVGRRLSVQFGGAKSANVPSGIRISEVRSLMFFGFFKCVPSIVQYRLLRVLVFHVWADEDNMSFDLDRIGELFLLRYLKIAGNIRVKLPEKMEQLRFLETLEVDARVNDVPLDIFLLKSLLHLRLPGGFVWPDEFGGMKSLLTLGHFDLNSNSEANIDNLGELTSLQDLHLTCSTVPNENSLEKNIKFLASVIGKLSNLRSVSLLHAGSSHAYTPDVTGSDRTLGVSIDGLSNVSPVPTFLQRIVLSRHYCVFSSLPRWIKETDCLQVLNITIKELLRDDINVLKRLLALTALSLYIHGAPLERIVFGNEGFPVLKYLKLVNTTTVPWLTFETGAMPNLRKLKLGFNAHRVDRHGSAPISIEHLTGAKEISAKIGCTGADEAETVLSAAVTNHPRNPRINIQLVDWKFYISDGTNLSTKAEPGDVINNSDEYDVDAGEASMEDESDQAVITDSGPWKHSSPMPAQETKSKQEVMFLEEEPERIEKTDGNNSKVGQGGGPNRDCTIHFDEGWAFVQQGINKLKNILEGRPEPQFTMEERMNLYTKVYDMCSQWRPHLYERKLYDKYRESFEEYLTSEVLPSLREKHGEFVLKELVKRWSNNKVMARWMSGVFQQLDKYYVSRLSLTPLKQVALTCFRELVYQDIKGKVKDILLELMQHEREGGHIDRDLLRNVLSIFVEIGIDTMEYYEDDIEMHLLKNTEDYYFVKAQSWIHGTACSDYLIKAEQYLKREQARDYLFGNTKELLLKKVQYELLGRYGDQILQNEHDGFRALLRDEKVKDLSWMYRLFSDVIPCLKLMSEMFTKHITKEGKALVEQAEYSSSNKKLEKKDMAGLHQDFVWKMVDLHEKYVAYVTECFQRHGLFHKALRHAFVVFCNRGVSGISNAKILSTFFDNFLTKDCSEKIGDEAIEDSLRKVVRLLVHIHDKDLFATFYREKLARRLLKEIANDEHERIMFRLLKELFGGQFTSKMEGMVADLIVGTEHQTGFKEYLNKHPELDPSINMAVTVLTMGFWPSYKNIDMRLPADMAKCVEVFEKSYKERMSGRKLNWMYSMGSCNMDAKFGAKSIELIVTPCQAALLLLFNGCGRLSYSEIVTELNLPDDDFAKHLLSSVSCAKYKILNKYPNNTTIFSSDIFEFNSEFSDRKRRVKIPVPHGVEKKKVVEEINMDRRYKIEATIVRIMKSRRVMGHTQLVTECVEQLILLFKPDVPSIKKRIEDLIHRDYMKRDEKNPNIYIYVGSWAEPEDTNERGQIDELKK